MSRKENGQNVHLIEKVKQAMLTMQRYSWEQGVAAQALLELGDVDLVILMAREAVLRRREDGRLGVMGANHNVTDPAANGEAVHYAAQRTGDPVLQKAADSMRDYLLHKAPKTAAGTLHHIDNEPQVWIDSMYMAPPFLAAVGQYEEALTQIEGFRQLLWQPDKKLYAHIWDDGAQEFVRQASWGVGNGWTAAGMTRVIRHLPAEMMSAKQRLAGYIRSLLDSCLNFQREDGLFHDVIDDPATFVETNLAQMLAYTIFRGTAAGWLSADYLEPAGRMRLAAQAKVDDEGLVQDVCGAPHFDHPGVAVEGQAFFLLMEAAYRDYLAGS